MGILKKHFGAKLYQVHYEVDEDQHQMRLDQFIQIYLKTFSREVVKKKIRDGEIKILNRPGTAKSSSKLNYGDLVELSIPRTIHEDEYWRGEKLQLNENPQIVFEDERIIVISKPAYMSAHPTGRHLFNCATVIFENRLGIPISAIHRLDRETSGVLILGKSKEATGEIGQLFENDKVHKCYFFIAVKNDLYKNDVEFWAEERLEQQDPSDMTVRHFPPSSKLGKKSKTFFQILATHDNYVIGLAFPKTGRQHQIRVHAQAHGLPLLGDKLYLGSYEMFQHFKDNVASKEEFDAMEISRHALHALALQISYEKRAQVFQSQIPEDLLEWLKEKTSIDIDILNNKISEKIETYFSKLI